MLKIAWIFGCFYPFWGLIFNFFEYFQHFCQILCMIAHRLFLKIRSFKKSSRVGVTYFTVFCQSSSATIRSSKIAESYADVTFFVAKISLIHDDYGQFYLRKLLQSSRVGRCIGHFWQSSMLLWDHFLILGWVGQKRCVFLKVGICAKICHSDPPPLLKW